MSVNRINRINEEVKRKLALLSANLKTRIADDQRCGG